MKLFVLVEDDRTDLVLDMLKSGAYFSAEDAGEAISEALNSYLAVLYTVVVTKPFPSDFDLVITEAEESDFAEHSSELEDFREWRTIYECEVASLAEEQNQEDEEMDSDDENLSEHTEAQRAAGASFLAALSPEQSRQISEQLTGH